MIIVDLNGGHIDAARALHRVVAAIDSQAGRDRERAIDRVTHLIVMTGRLGEAVLAAQHDDGTNQPASSSAEALTVRLKGVLAAAAGVGNHYRVQAGFPTRQRPRTTRNPYVLLTYTTTAVATLTEIVRALEGLERNEDRRPTGQDLTEAVALVLRQVIGLVDCYDLRARLLDSIQASYRAYQQHLAHALSSADHRS